MPYYGAAWYLEEYIARIPRYVWWAALVGLGVWVRGLFC